MVLGREYGSTVRGLVEVIEVRKGLAVGETEQTEDWGGSGSRRRSGLGGIWHE